MTDHISKDNALIVDLRRALREKYTASSEIQAEFVSAEDYASFVLAESSGMVRKMREHYDAILGEAAIRRAQKAGRLHMVH